MKLAFVSLFLCSSLTFYGSSNSVPINGEIVRTEENVKIIKVWGTHRERGFAYGYLLGEDILTVHNEYITPLFRNLYEDAKALIQDTTSFKIPNQYVIEAKGIVAGMKAKGVDVDNFDEWDLLLSNSFLDVMGFAYTLSQGKHGCSSLISWGDATKGTDLDGKSIISRHLDWSADASLIENNVVVIHIPSEKGEQPWAMIGFAGQMSALSGVNQQGVGVFQHVVFTSSSSSELFQGYEPIWFSLRKGIESKDYNHDGQDDVNDIKSVIEENKNGYADSFIISAIANSQNDKAVAIIAELDPKAPFYSFRGNDYTDSIPGDNLYTANSEIKRKDKNIFCSRYESTRSAIGGGENIDSHKNWELSRDHSNCEELGWDNVQFMQFIPNDLLLKLAVYKNGKHAFQNEPIEIDLNSLFIL